MKSLFCPLPPLLWVICNTAEVTFIKVTLTLCPTPCISSSNFLSDCSLVLVTLVPWSVLIFFLILQLKRFYCCICFTGPHVFKLWRPLGKYCNFIDQYILLTWREISTYSWIFICDFWWQVHYSCIGMSVNIFICRVSLLLQHHLRCSFV